MDIPGILPTLRKVELTTLMKQVRLKLKLSEAKAKERMADLLRFYTLCGLYPSEPLAPSASIDEIWHLHILDTRHYAKDCEKGLGFFLNHTPWDGSEGDAHQLKSAFERTSELYQRVFDCKLSGTKSDAANFLYVCGR